MESGLGLAELLFASVGPVPRAKHLNRPHRMQRERKKPRLDSSL